MPPIPARTEAAVDRLLEECQARGWKAVVLLCQDMEHGDELMMATTPGLKGWQRRRMISEAFKEPEEEV